MPCSVQFSLWVMSDCLRPHGLQHARVSVHHHLLELAQTHVHQGGDAIQPSHSLSLASLLALNLSSIRVFSKELALCIRWPKYWSFSLSISPTSKYSGLISFMIDCFDLLAVQGTLKSLLHHHSSKASILQHSAFFMVQLPHLSMIIGKTIALTTQTFIGKVISLLFNTLSRFVIAFLPVFTQIFLGFPGGSAGKESACNVGDLGSIPGLERCPERLPTAVFCPGECHGLYSPWGCKESDTTEWLSLFFNPLFHFAAF